MLPLGVAAFCLMNAAVGAIAGESDVAIVTRPVLAEPIPQPEFLYRQGRNAYCYRDADGTQFLAIRLCTPSGCSPFDRVDNLCDPR